MYAAWNAQEKGVALETEWSKKFAAYREKYPELATEFLRRMSGEMPDDWQKKSSQYISDVQSKNETIASRKASQNCLNNFAACMPELLGGSADLTLSNLTRWTEAKTLSKETPGGNYIYYGVREFGMSAIMNGLALHGGFIPFGGTFLTFVDYARNAVRMAAIMKQRVIFVYTHDSIGLGEDGPTHQPVEHLAMLRLTPGLSVWRACDAVESAVAWQLALERRHMPTCLLFSRQNLPHQTRDKETVKNIARGAYVLMDSLGTPDVIIIATGSEVSLAVDAAKQLTQQNYRIRVVSMPSTDTFAMQDAAYQESVLPLAVTKRVAIEAGAKDYWYKYVGQQGKIIGLDRFGESAPGNQVFQALGITVDNLIKSITNFSAVPAEDFL
jgi:transketolase